jgi:DNA-binding transcriptional ArsR family regulator
MSCDERQARANLPALVDERLFGVLIGATGGLQVFSLAAFSRLAKSKRHSANGSRATGLNSPSLQPPKLSKMTRPEIDAHVAREREELAWAADLIVDQRATREPSVLRQTKERHAKILGALSRDLGITSSHVSEAVGAPRTIITQDLPKLENAGLVRRVRVPKGNMFVWWLV